MRADLLQLAADLARRNEPFVLAVVVRRLPASSSREGDMALVTASGDFHGWLGGSCTQPLVLREAERALADGRPRLLALAPDPEAERRPGVVALPMTCHSGGSVEIYIEPFVPAPRLAIFGESPIAAAVLEIGKAMGWTIEGGAGVPARGASSHDAGSRPPLFAVVATVGENDEESIERALAAHPAYLGVVASRRRFADIRSTLLARGIAAAALDTIRCPAGLNIGARSPAEIAVSIVAEIVERQRAVHSAEKPAGMPAAAAPTESVPVIAIDPVCGMSVVIAKAKFTAEHDGRTFYFCGGGCKAKFLASPHMFPGTPTSE